MKFPTAKERAARKRFDSVLNLAVKAAKLREEAMKLTGAERQAKINEYTELLKTIGQT